jgi:hypothetical protein
VPKQKNIWERIDFTPQQHRLLKDIAKRLGLTLPGAVEYALDFGLVPLARGALFFDRRVETAPGSRVLYEDLWAAFQEWTRSLHFQGQMSAAEFAVIFLNRHIRWPMAASECVATRSFAWT